MSQSYVSAKIQEALKATGGNKHDAQKLIITWAVRDPTLMLGLAKPHMKGIVAAWIDHENRSGKKKTEKAASFTEADAKAILEGTGAHEKRKAVKVPPPKASAHQATVMQHIVDAFKKK